MDMSGPVVRQYLISVVTLLLGISGWLLPYKWNLLRLRARYAKYVSDRTNQALPKILGTILIIAGILTAIVTAQVGSFER